jgi:hypothetical protein
VKRGTYRATGLRSWKATKPPKKRSAGIGKVKTNTYTLVMFITKEGRPGNHLSFAQPSSAHFSHYTIQ